jgi:hypothetical protein
MNPWLEEYWRDVRARLLVYACDQLNGELPPDLTASVDERLVIDREEEEPCTYVPDVAITESWDSPGALALGPGGATVEAAKPIVVDRGETKVRRLEITDSKGHLIIVIEFLSPSNKTDLEARWLWDRRRKENLAAGLSFVEIDLVRAGSWTLPDHDGRLRLPPRSGLSRSLRDPRTAAPVARVLPLSTAGTAAGLRRAASSWGAGCRAGFAGAGGPVLRTRSL